MPTGTASRVAIRNILLATDFSTFSDAALPYAAGLAKRYDSTLSIVNVVPSVLQTLPADPQQAVREAAENLSRIAAAGVLQGTRHREFVGNGEIAAALNAFAEQNQADLIVLGTHGRKGLDRLLLGSVAEEVFRRSKCPVLTVGPRVDEEARVELRHVLYATEFGEASQHGLPYALSLAEEHRAQLTLLHVTGVNETPPDEIEQHMRDLVPDDASLPAEPEFLVAVGEPPQVIAEIARRIRADIVVLGVKRPMAVGGTHLRAGTAYRVVCEASCPVLTVGREVEA